jgi:hypothetical protein
MQERVSNDDMEIVNGRQPPFSLSAGRVTQRQIERLEGGEVGMMRERMKNFELMQEQELTAPWVAVYSPLGPCPSFKGASLVQAFWLIQAVSAF